MRLKTNLLILSLLFPLASFSQIVSNQNLPVRSDVMSVLKYHTNVKAQVKRNLCTVFATLGTLEALYLRNNTHLQDVDLSEEWVQYLVSVHSPTGGGNGSTVASNISYIKSYGVATEQALPYDGLLWSLGSPTTATERCGSLKNLDQKKCLMGHFSPYLLKASEKQLQDPASPFYSPEFLKGLLSAKSQAATFSPYISSAAVSGANRIKGLLAQGIPVIAEFDIYYGAWNISEAPKLGIEMDPNAYAQGVVNYPEKNSMDRTQSLQKKNRHAVILVGYDDDIEVTYKKRMTDGSLQEFKRRGVYYFKNSWGQDHFGSKFSIGSSRIRGFGMMTQAYADELAKFTVISLSDKAVIQSQTN